MGSDQNTSLARRCLNLIALALAVSLSGCGGESDDLPRVEVSGEVSKNGSPIKEGRVNFVPEGATKGPASGAGIVNGKFLIPRVNGPVPGTYLVRVEVTVESAEPPPESPDRMPSKDEILAGKEAPAVDPAVGGESPAQPGVDPASLEFHVTVEEGGSNRFLLPIGGEASLSE